MVLSSDGESSFAFFIYERNFTRSPSTFYAFQVGFDNGDRVRTSDIPPDSLEAINIFRIDGMIL